jgi:hypothetical protein
VAKAAPAQLPAIPKSPRVVEDVKAALAVSAAELRRAAPEVIKKLVAAALDESNPLHEKAVLMLGERLLPVRGFAQSLVTEAGGTMGGVSVPNVNITVISATPDPARLPMAALTVSATERRHIPDESPDGDSE